MDQGESRGVDRREIRWTTGFLENSEDPLHREILFLLTNGVYSKKTKEEDHAKH